MYELSGNLPAYKNQIITEINGYLNKIVVGGQDIYPGDILNDKDENTFRRVQIRERLFRTCKKKSNSLKKALRCCRYSLLIRWRNTGFMMKLVNRLWVNTQGYLKKNTTSLIFFFNDFLDLFQQEYNDYLKDTDLSKVHKGYMPTNTGST